MNGRDGEAKARDQAEPGDLAKRLHERRELCILVLRIKRTGSHMNAQSQENAGGGNPKA